MRVALLLPASFAALLMVPAAAAAQSTGSPATGEGRVAGRVVTPYGDVLSSATVTLAADAASTGGWTTSSTAGGTFTFDHVPAGRYTLSATKPGYTVPAVTPPARLRSEYRFSLAGGEQIAGIELVLRRSGSIAGRILRPDGTPAPGTRVMAALREGDRLATLTDAQTVSEWDGRYEITGLPPGDFLVLVLPARPNPPPLSTPLPIDVSSAPLRFDPTLYPGVPQSQPGGTVAVYEGVATEGIDVWLTPAPQRFAVSGRVFWPEGLEVENLVIEYGGSPAVRSGVWYVDDPGGLFTLTGISQGTLVMLARADSNRGPLIGLATTDVLVGTVEEVRLELSQPGRVSGRIIYQGSPPPSATPHVSLVHTLLKVSPLFPVEEATPGPDGRFEIPYARGTYRIEVRGLPHGWKVTRVLRNGSALAGNLLLVHSGHNVEGLDIVVAPGAP